MSQSYTDLLEIILRECAASHPEPWYPSSFSRSTGVPREPLDACLDQLRMRGLIQLTPWVHEYGQGYQLTQHGAEVLHQPRLLTRLRRGDVPPSTAVTTGQGIRPGPGSYTATGPGYERHALAEVRGEKVRMALMDESRPIVTQVLLMLNILYFLVGLFVHVSKFGGSAGAYLSGMGNNGSLGQTYHAMGSLYIDDLVLEHQWWRLITYGFLHGGALHIGMNMFALYNIGPLLERMWSRWPYLALYLISCVGSGACAMFLTPNASLVGASGAICGLLGSMASWLLLNKAHLPPRIVQDWQRQIMTNIVLIAILSFLPGISWAGHLGGGVTGALIAIPLNMAHFDTGVRRWLGWGGTALAVVLALGLFQAALGRRGDAEVRVMEKASNLIANKVRNVSVHKEWPGDAKEQAATYRQTKQELEAALVTVQQFNPRDHSNQERFFKTGIALLELAIPYCEHVANALQSKETWTAKKRAELRAEFDKIQEAFTAHAAADKNLKQGAPDDGGSTKNKGGKDKIDKGNDQTAFAKNKTMLFKAEEQARDTLNNLARPLLPPRKREWPGDSEAAKLVKMFRTTKQDLAKVVDHLKQAAPDRQPEVNDYFGTGITFLQKTAHFCDKMAAALESPKTWTDEQQKALNADFQEFQQLVTRHHEAWQKLQQAQEDKGK
jgi:membrane associated rhomboid family serine protease